MKAPFAVLVSIVLLYSEMASSQDINMISSVVSYGFQTVQDCAKENTVGLMKIATSIAFSRGAIDKNSNCAIACVMENFFLMMDDKVETTILSQVIDMIPIQQLKEPIEELVNMCAKKGAGPNRCDNAGGFVMCIRQNSISVASKAFFKMG